MILNLQFRCDHKVPKKKDWVNPKVSSRLPWSMWYETIVNWFCSSNSMHVNRRCSIFHKQYVISLIGEELRYLSPNYRSIAALMSKAATIISQHPDESIVSTPGITIQPFSEYITFKPLYILEYGTPVSTIPDIGTIDLTGSIGESIKIPATSPSQAVIWLNYSHF